VTYADASAKKRKKGFDGAMRLVIVEQTRLVAILHLWTLTRVDLTRNGVASGGSGDAFGRWQERAGERGPDAGAVRPVILCCVRSSLNASAGIPDRWDRAMEVEHVVHVARIQRPDAKWRASDRLDRRIRSPRARLLCEPNDSISMEPL
jgi:hypothetical protein